MTTDRSPRGEERAPRTSRRARFRIYETAIVAVFMLLLILGALVWVRLQAP